MKASILAVFSSAALLWNLAAGASIPTYFEKYLSTRADLTNEQIRHELGSKVSNDALIYGPEGSLYEYAISRWTTFSQPQVRVVIEPAKESDVAAIVRYCNANSIDFVAISGGYGLPATLATFKGIQISMRKLNKTVIQPGNKTAWIQGGSLVGEVIRSLWDKGYITTTGSCECVGMSGAGLGGGHGRLEGLFGMIVDNLHQLNVVLANGTAVRVNTTNHSDLLWGMKGAGHNFGVVTSFEINIFPRGPDTWHYHNYVFRGEQLEAIFETLNTFHGNGTTPLNSVNFPVFAIDPEISVEEPAIFLTMAYRGGAEEAEAHFAPFNALESIKEREQIGDVPYPEIPDAQGTGDNTPICQHGIAQVTSTVGLSVYNITAERLIFEDFKRHAAEDLELALGVNILHEGYATAAVEVVDPADTAFPFRFDRHLVLFYARVSEEHNGTASGLPHVDSTREQLARFWAAEMRDRLNAGEPDRLPHVYLNYADGTESLEERYGYESWRIQRLKDLKASYDPQNRFRFYNPIPIAN